MKKSHKTEAEAAADYDDSCFSPFSCLPDEVVLEILKKVMVLKTLCVCQVVSKRFYAIVHQVDTICHTTWLPSASNSIICGGFKSMTKFKRVKSLCIQIPSNYNNDDNGYLFKWKVKLGKNRIDSFVFVLPTSIYDNNNKGLLLYGEEEEAGNVDSPLKKYKYLKDAFLRVLMLWCMAVYIPLLEKVSITDSDNRGRVSVNGRENIEEIRSWDDVDYPERVSQCCVPLLELPVSGYVMKGVTLVVLDWNDVPCDVTYDSFINDEIDFKYDKEEAAYHEAMMKIFKKHRGSIVRLL